MQGTPDLANAGGQSNIHVKDGCSSHVVTSCMGREAHRVIFSACTISEIVTFGFTAYFLNPQEGFRMTPCLFFWLQFWQITALSAKVVWESLPTKAKALFRLLFKKEAANCLSSYLFYIIIFCHSGFK